MLELFLREKFNVYDKSVAVVDIKFQKVCEKDFMQFLLSIVIMRICII